MLVNRNTSEAYWNSYRLLEKQLIRISHSIYFDDEQIDVYSSELADIINSACIKIESLAKDIYENHIFPFQIDLDITPISFKGSPSKFNEKWTREKWKYDYNCLVEIDKKFSLGKKRVQLKIERFHFSKYGRMLLPFSNISVEKCEGGKWEHHTNEGIWSPPSNKLENVDWCKSYQDIKHNYIQSIPKHGTVKNAIMVLAAFYLLAIYNTCLPSRYFDWDYKSEKYELDFGSELFTCGMCNYTLPPFIIDSDYIEYKKTMEQARQNSPHKEILEQQDILGDIEGLPFLLVLTDESFKKVKELVSSYCMSKNIEKFDISPYEKKKGNATSEGMELYLKIRRYIRPPYHPSDICVAFNAGLNEVYEHREEYFDYEKSKYEKKTKEVLSILKIGDFVDAKFQINTVVSNGEVKEIDEHTIKLDVNINGKQMILIEPIANIIYIKKL